MGYYADKDKSNEEMAPFMAAGAVLAFIIVIVSLIFWR